MIGSGIGSGLNASASDSLSGSQTWGIPAGFDVDSFVTAAKRNFVTLQDAWDRSDISALRSMMTDAMVVEIRNQLAEREPSSLVSPTRPKSSCWTQSFWALKSRLMTTWPALSSTA